MEYKKTVLKRDFEITDVISVHYFEYTVDFAFSGELHDFWEFVYADKNELIITASNKEIILPQGTMFLHKPMEFHNVRGNGTHAPNSVILSFSSPARLFRSFLYLPLRFFLLFVIFFPENNGFFYLLLFDCFRVRMDSVEYCRRIVDFAFHRISLYLNAISMKNGEDDEE